MAIAGSSSSTIWIQRLGPSGQADPSFGDGGTALVTLGGGLVSSARIAPLPSGQVAVTVSLIFFGGGGGREAVVFRLDPDGTVDPTFGAGGFQTSPPNATTSTTLTGFSLASDAQGGLILQHGLYPVRLDPTGALVPTFGINGHVDLLLPPPWNGDPTIAHKLHFPRAARYLADGGLRVVGEVYRDQAAKSFGLSMAQYTAAGGYDAPFPDGGIAISGAVLNTDLDLFRSTRIHDDGSACQLYARYAPTGFTATLVRLHPNGHLDTGYATAVTYEPDGMPYDLEPVGVQTTRAGHAVALFFGGPRGMLFPISFLVTRRMANGQADLAFPTGGRGLGWAELTEANNTWQDFTLAFDVDADDSVLVVASYRPAAGAPRISSVYRVKP